MKSCRVRRSECPIDLAAAWDSPLWEQAETLTLTQEIGPGSGHVPQVEVRLLHDGVRICWHFLVHDRFVRAVAPCDQACVCRDSCAEFFVRPAGSERYFNFEMNCSGKLLLYAIRDCRSGDLVIPLPEELARVERFHTLPDRVEPEITDSVTWRLCGAVPVDFFARYAQVRMPLSGQRWRANFTKCADGCSHPHWLSWVPLSRFDFHLPEEFGELVFE